MTGKKIEKEWCTYGGGVGCWGFGRIVREPPGGSLYIQYIEGQFYPPECWDPDPRYVKRFETLEEAAEVYGRYKEYSKERIQRLMRENFPSYFKGKE